MALKPEIVQLRMPHQKGEYRTVMYNGARPHGLPSDFDEVLVLAPGWLGSGTLHYAASRLAEAGHDVAVVSHDQTSLIHPNKDRSKHVHFTAKAAAQATGKQRVILLGHSNGSQDVHHAAAEALRRQTAEPRTLGSYQITAIGALAGAGLSGTSIRLQELYREGKGAAEALREHPVEELHVVGRSIANLLRHPFLSVIEGVAASQCDVRDEAHTVIRSGSLRAYREEYFDGDGVIPLPVDRSDYHTLPGSHLTPIVCGETMVAAAARLYEGNDPNRLQIAQANPLAA